LSADEALIALMIAAMESSGNVAAVEAARAAELVRLMPQFRKHSRLVTDRMVERMRIYVRDHDDHTIVAAACEAIPPRARSAAFMTVAAVLMSDHRLQRREAAFLLKLSAALLPSQPIAARRGVEHDPRVSTREGG
jgi:hypothetical protein